MAQQIIVFIFIGFISRARAGNRQSATHGLSAAGNCGLHLGAEFAFIPRTGWHVAK
jgi:hypothetical protein